MALISDCHAITITSKLEKCDYVLKKLCRYRATKQIWKPVIAEKHIILNLLKPDLVVSILGLDRESILDARFIDTYIYLIGFNLFAGAINRSHARSQMILQ